MHLSPFVLSSLGVSLLLLSTQIVSAVTIYVTYCGQNDAITIMVPPDTCSKNLAYQDFCGFTTEDTSTICNLYNDLECQEQPLYTGTSLSAQNKGVVASIKCQ
ncbi:hypothetical protein BDB00DRAFT_826499 [Zychaea mexicana]|uniref:uncharacterized protein n=1 Tax=Zychaea mexicana TaxID=64656 RepID=UPI0022FDEFB1|nr:uncharacterized protein BDB00DRAFT_826499 [Zychaea mexicana]KAI9492805.1 hypothetical protein BDB00DRAFT_826499 [Zychaea mexicana]